MKLKSQVLKFIQNDPGVELATLQKQFQKANPDTIARYRREFLREIALENQKSLTLPEKKPAPKKGGTSSAPPLHQNKYTILDDNAIERMIIDKANENKITDALIGKAIEFWGKVKGNKDTMEKYLDMEEFALITELKLEDGKIK